MRGQPFVGPGSNCGTATMRPTRPGSPGASRSRRARSRAPTRIPFGLVVTTVGGTPFNPNITPQPTSAGFFFSRRGTDTVTTGGNERNIVLLGGGVAADPDSGNSFFRIMDLRMTLNVPEPTAALGLFAGAGALAMIARRRRG